MPDDPDEQRPHDSQRINVDEEFEVRYWTKKFHISESELKQTVRDVGPQVKDVRRELGK